MLVLRLLVRGSDLNQRVFGYSRTLLKSWLAIVPSVPFGATVTSKKESMGCLGFVPSGVLPRKAG